MSSEKWRPLCLGLNVLTNKQVETHGCVHTTVAIGALVLQNQAISVQHTDKVVIAMGQYYIEISQLSRIILWNKITFRKKYAVF